MIAIRPFTEEWTGAVRDFNARIAGTGFDYPLVPAPDHFLAVEDTHMRGGYILGRQRFWLQGKALDVAHYRLFQVSQGGTHPGSFGPHSSNRIVQSIFFHEKQYRPRAGSTLMLDAK